MISLFGSYTSPFVRHCRIALDQAQLDWQFVETDYARSGKESPTKRVPYLQDGDVQLTDSMSILQHIAQQSSEPLYQNVNELEQLALINTALDASINIFLLERDKITPENSPYMARQAARVDTIMTLLNSNSGLLTVCGESLSLSQTRLACFLDWAQYRQRIDIAKYPNLAAFLGTSNSFDWFRKTAPDQTT